ncbi:methyltransferase [Paenibacillus yonginensis]|uniref:Methyltransferase n=1 Tax=Paenibacillus yonginensis TaxID=1462996 RepID=A0A1B1N3U3_9BACL|nr:class I SAM-dependent methyltransferase [Paenibacillus yonginensis]ANS76087.1 methyltransferase [Paenibacillus yonginensis]
MDNRKREGKVRDSDVLEVLECNNCGLVYLSSFDHINDKFYEDSGMLSGKVNIKEYRANSLDDDQRRFHHLKKIIQHKKLLDFGCGAGGFLNMAKQLCSSVSGVELDKKINEYLNEFEGLKVYKSAEDVTETYDIITLFHVLEHLSDPIKMLKQLSGMLNNHGRIIVEVPSSNDALLTLYKNEAFSEFTYWSCHLYLFNEQTLSEIATKAGLTVDYITQVQRYPLSNHLYWLSNNKPGGHQVWNFLDSESLKVAYERQLANIGKCDTLFASFSLGNK